MVRYVPLNHDAWIPLGFPSGMTYLRHLVAKGASMRWGTPLPKEVSDRLEYELSTIEQLGNAGTRADYASFFLFVRDYVEATRRMGAWVGPGRGALAGSAVAHALGITGVDPIKHGLLFERFLNLDRISMPNIDIEFDDEGRGEVQRYIAERYGRDHVAHVVTFGLMSPKRAIDVKIGLLGSATLAIQKECVRLIKERTGRTTDLEHIPENDEATLSVFAKSDTSGIPQFETPEMREWLKELNPSCFKDIVAMNALCCPKLKELIPSFIRRKNGEEPIEYDHPLMEGVLRETYGLTVYQEQMMELSQTLADFSRCDSDKMRKAMGLKKLDVTEDMKPKFTEGCLSNKKFRIGKWESEDEARRLIDKTWGDWYAFASHAFNKSHAVACAWHAYQSAYLKAHYPKEFLCARVRQECGNPDAIERIICGDG